MRWLRQGTLPPLQQWYAVFGYPITLFVIAAVLAGWLPASTLDISLLKHVLWPIFVVMQAIVSCACYYINGGQQGQNFLLRFSALAAYINGSICILMMLLPFLFLLLTAISGLFTKVEVVANLVNFVQQNYVSPVTLLIGEQIVFFVGMTLAFRQLVAKK